jgi:hypothetical protein
MELDDKASFCEVDDDCYEGEGKIGSNVIHEQDGESHDFGKVRLRRDCHPLRISLTPILPSPYHEFSFAHRTGWRYHPTAPFLDRLGSGRQLQGRPTTAMKIPPSWTSRIESAVGRQHHERQDQDESDGTTTLPMGGAPKRQRVAIEATPVILISGSKEIGSSSITVVSNSTTRSSSTSGDASGAAASLGGANGNLGVPPTARSSPQSELREIAMDATAAVNPLQSAANDFTLRAIPSSFPPTLVFPRGGSTPSGGDPTNSATPPSGSSQVALRSPCNDNMRGNTTVDGVPPKAALYQLYGKKPRKTQLKPSDYITWDNGMAAHQLQFSSIFLCPISKEAFLAGPWGDCDSGHYKELDGLYWYPRKILAEHAAAARAWDCIQLRDGTVGANGATRRLGDLKPYWPSQRPSWPVERIPSRVLELLPLDQRKNPDDHGGAMEVRTTDQAGTSTANDIHNHRC